MADGKDGCPAGQAPTPEPGPESGEEFEIVNRSQLPGAGELRGTARPRPAAEGWSVPILTLARKATGNLSASYGGALRTAAGLGGADSGADGAARAGRLRPGAPRVRSRDRGYWRWQPGGPSALRFLSRLDESLKNNLLTHLATRLCSLHRAAQPR